MVVTDGTMWERDDEQTVIADSITAVRSGLPSFLVLEGPAGIGKTRLLQETVNRAREVGIQTLIGRGSPLEAAFSFGLARQLFEPVLSTASPEETARWLAGTAAQARGALGQVLDAAPSGDFAVLHGMYWLTVNLAQDRPLLIAVDDLHWVDSPSLRYLAHLLPRLDDLPVAVVVALRSGEVASASQLWEQMLTAREGRWLLPRPLSRAATAAVVAEQLRSGEPIDSHFVDTCHTATGGNPLLVRQLADALVAAGLNPATADPGQVLDLGARSVARLVELQFSRLSSAAQSMAYAVAVLGDDVSANDAARLAGVDVEEAKLALEELETNGVLQTRDRAPGTVDRPWSYVHPLVAAAVYRRIPGPERIARHARAVDVLRAGDVERVAAHLLLVPPTGRPDDVEALRRAASAAQARGAPDVAYRYLRRTLQEPLPPGERLDLLVAAGTTASLLDMASVSAVPHLREAVALAGDPTTRGGVAVALAQLLVYLYRFDDARAVLAELRGHLPELDEDLRRRFLATELVAVMARPGVTASEEPPVAGPEDLAALALHDSVGGRQLAGVISVRSFGQGEPDAVGLARHALSGNTPLDRPSGAIGTLTAWWTLAFSDDPGVTESVEAAVSRAHRSGATGELVAALTYRMLVRLRGGELEAAVADGRDCMAAIDTAGIAMARTHLGPWLAEAYLELGRLAEAEATLEWVETDERLPPTVMYVVALARLQRLRGQPERGLRTASRVGELLEAAGSWNPAPAPWRSEAALCLYALGQHQRAREYALREAELAADCRATVAWGRALRVAGVVTVGEDGVDLLEQAVVLLADTTGRLEYAKALVDAGAAWQRAGQRTPALRRLREGVRMAERCGAGPLVEQGLRELRAAGARDRRSMLSGPAALTVGERRVAELTVTSMTNRDIAQRLFITPKTVEVHLSSVYRKLGISGRDQLSPELLRM